MSPDLGSPKTLAQAHELLNRQRPDRDATPDSLAAYYRRSARTYREVAELDGAHYREAIYWANRAEQAADEISDQGRREQ